MLDDQYRKSGRSNPSGNCLEARWTKSSRSLEGNCLEARFQSAAGCSDGTCAEVAYIDGMVQVRDSKDKGAGPVLSYTRAEWEAFLGGVRDGDFDLPPE